MEIRDIGSWGPRVDKSGCLLGLGGPAFTVEGPARVEEKEAVKPGAIRPCLG